MSITPLQRAQAWLHGHIGHLPPTVRGLVWSAASGALFCVLNAIMRSLTLQLAPMQAQFLRYLFGLLVMLPLVWHGGLAVYRPNNMAGQFTRGAVHTVGLVLWFLALPHLPLADTTAIGFTGPLFIMIGAWLFLKEPMRWERWLATAIGFGGVLIVVAPKLGLGLGSGSSSGHYHLLMLASAPVFAASFLITKALTRIESAGVIVLWQAISVTLFSLPMALWVWQWPNAAQWLGFLLWCAGQRRALLPDTQLPRGRHFFYAVDEVSGPGVVVGVGLAAVCRCADADHADRWRADLRRHVVGDTA